MSDVSTSELIAGLVAVNVAIWAPPARWLRGHSRQRGVLTPSASPTRPPAPARLVTLGITKEVGGIQNLKAAMERLDALLDGEWAKVRDLVGRSHPFVGEREEDCMYFVLDNVIPTLTADKYTVVGMYGESDRKWSATFGGDEKLFLVRSMDDAEGQGRR